MSDPAADPGSEELRKSRGGFLAALALLAAAGAGVSFVLLRPVPAMHGERVELPLPPQTAPAAITAGREQPQAAPAAQSLAPAPDPALVEGSADGPLPIIGPDGRQPWRVYARPFDRTDKRPRVAILLRGLGLDGNATKQAIQRLPPEVSLAFSPYGRQLADDIVAARQAGHEVLLGLPLEPADYPRQDPGPNALLTSLDDQQNLKRLDWIMSRATGYVGLSGIMGSRFTASRRNLEPVLDQLKRRGLMFVDPRSSEQSVGGSLARELGMPWAASDLALDGEAASPALDKALGDLEGLARRNGAALGLAPLYPATLDRIIAWAATLRTRGVALAPVSAVANTQPAPKAAAQ